ncbi:hypothetical protein BDN67DRAFT_426099 [Paxillus ammoniavirescens]|nr:hypothetical protein BDN67DRAFT_426099 [Paxillus ammoniavirescens]
MLIWQKRDATQPQLDRQQAIVGAQARTDVSSRESTAKEKGKHREPEPNPAPARNTGHASIRTTKRRPATSASQHKRRLPDRVARVRQADMGRRNGSTTQAHSRLENMAVGYGNSTERGAAGPSRVRRDSSNRRPCIRRTRDSEVVEVMEGHMPDRYVSGHKYAKKKRSSSLESGSGSGSGDTEDEAEDSGEGEPEGRPIRNTTPGGLIGILCFCSCIS